MRRYALRDDQWDRIKDFLPGREGHVGGTSADNRLFVDAVLYRYRAGIPWRDLPERFGDWKVVYQRFSRWAKSGVFARIFKMLASDHDNEYMTAATLFHLRGAGLLFSSEHNIPGQTEAFGCSIANADDPTAFYLLRLGGARHAASDTDH